MAAQEPLLPLHERARTAIDQVESLLGEMKYRLTPVDEEHSVADTVPHHFAALRAVVDGHFVYSDAMRQSEEVLRKQ